MEPVIQKPFCNIIGGDTMGHVLVINDKLVHTGPFYGKIIRAFKPVHEIVRIDHRAP